MADVALFARSPGDRLVPCWPDRQGRPFLCAVCGNLSCAAAIVVRAPRSKDHNLRVKEWLVQLRRWGYHSVTVERISGYQPREMSP